MIVAVIGRKLKGATGAVAGAVIEIVVHEALDAPVAGVVAAVS